MDTGLGGCNEFTAMGLMFLVPHGEVRRFASSGQRSRFPVGLMLRYPNRSGWEGEKMAR